MDLSTPAHMQVVPTLYMKQAQHSGYLKKYCSSLITKLEILCAISKYYTKATIERHTINL